MHCSIPTWPTYSNPAAFIPVVTDFYPFDSEKPVRLIQNAQPECCSSCKHLLDSYFTWEGDKVKCCWCSKSTKPNVLSVAQEQTKSKRYIFRNPAPPEYRQLLIFAVDSCVKGSEMELIRAFVMTAIAALPENKQFMLCVMNSKQNTFVDVYENTVVYFDVPHTISACKHLNLTRDLTTLKDLAVLEPFIKAIPCDPEKSKGVDSLIKQLKGDTNLFIRIILFSSKGPTDREHKNICIDWISPSLVPQATKINIDGYFLDMSLYGFNGKPAHDQIRNLIQKATQPNQYFNVNIQADVSNYKCNKTDFSYAACVQHFSQTFVMSSQKFLGSILPSIFAVNVNYVHFINNECYLEQEWCSQSYPKSDDFIPVASGVDPYQLLPYLLKNNKLKSFVSQLMSAYHQNIENFPGNSSDSTLAAFPNLQWFLRVEFGGRRDVFNNFMHNRAFLNYFSKSSTYYPNLSLWEDQNNCIAKKCAINKFFFIQMQCPPIVVLDEAQAISIYTDEEISEDSVLAKTIHFEENDRFPKPVVIYRPMKDVDIIFADIENLFKDIQNNFS